ncbi:hypothetical protein [Salinicola rhizosphaerae]|nr:hypothetical protein [Salinicola rhizosphaerae]
MPAYSRVDPIARAARFTALTMVRGESDIVWSSLLHHARLGFQRLIVISYLEHEFLRRCIDRLRGAFPEVEIDLVELESRGHFGRRKAFYVNRALSLFLDGDEDNFVYCFDADEFLSLGRYPTIGEFHAAFLSTLPMGTKWGAATECFALPWLNLIPKRASSVDRYRQQDLSAQFLAGDYLCVDSRENSRHKVLFRKRPATRVHMAYHQAFRGEKDVPVEPDPLAAGFVEQSGACVYHVPLRNPDQFRERLTGPMRRALTRAAAKGSPHDTPEAANDEPMGETMGEPVIAHDFAEALFAACTSSQPQFKSLAEAADVFGEAITDRKIRAITRFIYRDRVDVGPVLGSTASSSRCLGMKADESTP